MSWILLYAKFDDAHIYMSDIDYGKYYCNNQKCHRMLLPYQGDLLVGNKLKADFVLLSSMNIFLATDIFVSVLTDFAKNDFNYKKIGENINILDVTSTCTINQEFVDESLICPCCKNPVSHTYGKAFFKDGLSLLKYPDNEKSQLCRTKITLRDSSRATYDLFARENLAKELKKFKCFDMIKCIEKPKMIN